MLQRPVIITVNILLDCDQQVLPPNVRLVSTSGTTEGDTVTLQCEDGLFPVIPVMITCNSAGVWSPNPAELVCSIMPGKYYSVSHGTILLKDIQ